jgi:hypothetical protein
MNSNLVACCTGKSAGLAPSKFYLRMFLRGRKARGSSSRTSLHRLLNSLVHGLDSALLCITLHCKGDLSWNVN